MTEKVRKNTINFNKCIQVTPEEAERLEAFVKEHPDLIQKLREPLEAEPRQRKLVATHEMDIDSISALASRVARGEKIANVDWQEVAFVGACVFVA